jgi:predicted MFS family arabinose efflux permease
LGVAFGVALSLGRIGSRSSRWILPSVAQSHGFRGAFWFTFCACVLSGIGNLVLIYLDQRAEKRVRIAETSLDKNLSHPLYLLNLIACNFFFGAMTVVYSMPHYLSDTYGYDETEATNITLIIYVFAIVLSPLCGYIVDTLGRRDTLLLSGMITLAASFLLLTFSNITAILLMIFIGLAYALVPM